MVVEGIVELMLSHPEFGWLLVIGAGAEQLFAPWETKVKQLSSGIERKIGRIEEMQKAQMTVLRAVVRTNAEVDTAKVDNYLEENGVTPEEFIRSRGEKRGSD